MNQHTYLRAYMAGIVTPTIFLLVVATVFCIVRYGYNIPVPIERVIVFPMAVVPNLWGLWNMLFVGSHARTHLSLGLHGAVLPVLLGPLGFLLTRALDFRVPHGDASALPIAAPVALIAYYLAWKYIVGFLNGVLGVAQT
jgi:hypothetical protein